MNDEQAAALRKAFPASVVGKLPRGGVTLDYVGHAATTDRLLSVDPCWTWEPLALDADGLPAMDKAGNLWIRLTVCGVTRLGVGDGKSQKERIGDAIRNAAMRFGVALDLWTRDELESVADRPAIPPRSHDVPAQEPPGWEPDHGKGDPSRPRTEAQSRKLFAVLGEKGLTDRAEVLAALGDILGREVESTKTLTVAECAQVIDVLEGGQ